MFDKWDEAKKARKEVRREMFGDRLRNALAPKEAATQWDLNDLNLDHEPIGVMHPGAAAVQYAREALTEFQVPSQINLKYAGMKRKSGSGAHRMSEGVVWVDGSFRSMSGVQHHFDVPIIVRQGHMVYPEVIVHNGRPRIMAQSTFDDIAGTGEIYRDDPDRKHMYAPPPNAHDEERRKQQPSHPTQSTGLFGLTATLRGYRKDAQIEEIPGAEGGSTMQQQLEEVERLLDRGSDRKTMWELEQIQHGLKEQLGKQSKAASHDGLDEAERDRDEMLQPGQEVSLNTDVQFRNRGGTIHTLSAGTKGTIIRDMLGQGDVFYVQFESCKAPVNKGDIE